MKNLIEAAEAALEILDRTHALNGGPCLGPEHCPMAETIRDLTLAIMAAKLAEHVGTRQQAEENRLFSRSLIVNPGAEPEATYPAHTVKDIDPSPSRPSFMPAQRLCVICDAALPPDADIHTNTCPNCGTAGGI